MRHQLLVLAFLYGHMQLGYITTQRDVYYRLVRDVPDQIVVNRAIQQCVECLGVPREALGVVAGLRGNVGGSLSYRGIDLRGPARTTSPSTPCSHAGAGIGIEGMTIPVLHEDLRVRPLLPPRRGIVDSAPGLDESLGDAAWPFTLHPNTRFLLVIEKHTVFVRLMEETLCRLVPCVMLTSQGYPSHAARVLAHNIHAAAPHLPVVALADFNPHGLSIVLQYKWGKGKMPDSCFYAVPCMHWLGVRSAHVLLPSPSPQALARRSGESRRHANEGPSVYQSEGTRREPRPPNCPVPPLGSLSLCPAPLEGAREATSSDRHMRIPVALPHTILSVRDRALLQGLRKELLSVAAAKSRTDCGKLGTGCEPCAACSGTASYLGLMRWVEETEVMMSCGIKAEVEALYSRCLWQASPEMERLPLCDDNFADWVCDHLLMHDYI